MPDAARGLSELAVERDRTAARGATRDDVSKPARETLEKGLALDAHRLRVRMDVTEIESPSELIARLIRGVFHRTATPEQIDRIARIDEKSPDKTGRQRCRYPSTSIQTDGT